MDMHFLPSEPERLWSKIQQLVAERAEAESTIAIQYAEEKKRTEEQFHEATARAEQTHQTARAELEAKYVASRKEVIQRCDTEHDRLKREHERICSDARTNYKKSLDTQNKKLKESQWEAHTVFEATKDGPKLRLAEIKGQLGKQREKLDELKQQADLLLVRRWQEPTVPKELHPAGWPDEADPTEQFNRLLKQVQQQWTDLLQQRIPGMFEGGTIFSYIPLFLLLGVVPVGLTLGWTSWLWMILGGAVGLALWGGLIIWLHHKATRQTAEAYIPFCQTFVDIDQAMKKMVAAAEVTCKKEEAAIAERLRVDLQKADEHFAKVTQQSRDRHTTEIKQADEHYPPKLTDFMVQRESELDRLELSHTRQMEQFETEYQEQVRQRQMEYDEAVVDLQRRHQNAWKEMADRWRTGLRRVEEQVDQLGQIEQERFFDWKSSDVSVWQPATETPSSIPFGHVTMDIEKIEGGISRDERLQPERTRFTLPALLSFPDRSLLLTASGEGRRKAIETIQSIMLRLLTGVRPGKVRFTVVDPVGLGESFSAFMHLADYDEQIITSRIWTEGSHIEQQLVNLTEHMENVIQVYLRNEFETIQQYNEFAGEMAEPYRVLVVANFPTNFTESAARRLASIVASGARCGVYVLLSVDKRAPMPHGFELSDLESQMLHLDWRQNQFVWKGSPLSKLPLELDTPPEAKNFTDLVRTVGEKVRDVDRVEVPFEFVIPEQQAWWKGDSSRELTIPLGRAGAMKLQHLNLGRGTSQHVLVAGKTGSGKSNLLHAIITNLALWYPPDQVELYLVDFKKGVEFKPYAEFHLPHAKVIAVESEREFGLSVLQQLDSVLKSRGDLFRQTGVQDLAGWRREKPDEPMPRVVLVIDEFQELFVEDDRIAQNAAQLLDRLVRQGRAFGMHVLLGSQTLAGAYSLPRATIGQMAVRIALQCSDSDAHLILSEENTAARLLTRPGEAIYNDANGLYEGNHPFQVVWLPDHQRTFYLQQIDHWARSHDCQAEPPIVFEGNAAADPRENRLLTNVLATSKTPTPGQTVHAWLGAAVAIKEPTSVPFQRQGGSNLLLVGHNEESALGILSSSLISLAAQTPLDTREDGPATFHILDGTRPESLEVDYWSRFCKVLPQKVNRAEPKNMAETIHTIAAELSRRQEQGIDDAPPLYLVIYDLGRFRDLRREEDVFSFSSRDDDAPPKPSAQFTKILREGPGLGIHTIVWCDTHNTLDRWLDRQAMHDFEMRVAFQMSAGDSSMLIDTADAGRLGTHRAIYYNSGLGEIEKFRPYGLPDKEWLAEVQEKLAARG